MLASYQDIEGRPLVEVATYSFAWDVAPPAHTQAPKPPGYRVPQEVRHREDGQECKRSFGAERLVMHDSERDARDAGDPEHDEDGQELTIGTTARILVRSRDRFWCVRPTIRRHLPEPRAFEDRNE
jgi:hypothetical protein